VKQPDYFYTSPIQIEEPLVYNDNSDKVENAQKMLKGLGFEPGRVDGYFSKQTETAVKSFQSKYDLPLTGQIDEQTGGKLEAIIIEEVRKEENDVQLQAAMNALLK
jgi:carboxyl-terminal processing protease